VRVKLLPGYTVDGSVSF